MSGQGGNGNRRVVLETRQIVKTFHDGERETMVLKGIDFAIREGDFLALMGPSGSGKSTLLSILGTLLQPTSGIVEVVGRPINELTDSEVTAFRNRHIGFVFQFHHLLPDFTALENVMFPSFPLHGRETDEAYERAADLLDRVGLGYRSDYKATQLSGGQKQRVAVARAVMMKPAIVLADEPTGNLDRESSREVMTLLRTMRDTEGTAFLISTHDDEIAKVCDRVVHIVDGMLLDPDV